MARDLRQMLKEDAKLQKGGMPQGHEERFLNKLEASLPLESKRRNSWWAIAATIVIFIGLGAWVFRYQSSSNVVESTNGTIATQTKTLGDVSPELKMVEDYYLASINLELSKVKFSPENKELLDGYLERLEELNNEYKKLSEELTKNGPNELTVNALIDNLKFRLNLLYRLRDQLQNLKVSSQQEETKNIT